MIAERVVTDRGEHSFRCSDFKMGSLCNNRIRRKVVTIA